MDLQRILSSKAIILFSELPSKILNSVAFDVIHGIASRYKFLDVPASTDVLNLQNGIVFRHGSFNGEHDINSLTVYRDGIICETSEDTDICELILDDLLNWLDEELSISVSVIDNYGRLFNSVIEVHVPKSFERAFEPFAKIGDLLSQKMIGHFPKAPELVVSKIEFGIDPAHSKNIPAAEFSFERRKDAPFEKNIYYSASQMRTTDHLDIIKAIEELLT